MFLQLGWAGHNTPCVPRTDSNATEVESDHSAKGWYRRISGSQIDLIAPGFTTKQWLTHGFRGAAWNAAGTIVPGQILINGAPTMRIGIATDHGGFAMKEEIAEALRDSGHEVIDFGALHLKTCDDYPDFVIPLSRAVAAKEVIRGVALCGTGVGASIAANKIPGVRAALIHDVFSARQGVEDDDMNVICFGGRVIGSALALELTTTFLAARFSGGRRHRRRLTKVRALEIC